MRKVPDRLRRLNIRLVTFDAVVSTSPNQIAIAPGELVREWNDNGRRYFEYSTRGKVLDFFSVLSARYQVMRDHWNDVVVPGMDYVVIENTLGKFGPRVENFNHVPLNVQSLVSDGR